MTILQVLLVFFDKWCTKTNFRVRGWVVCAYFRKESPKALEAYLHALHLLTTVDEGLQNLGET